MGERMHSKEFLAERLEGLKYEYGETFIPVSADTEEILGLPIETLKTRFPERYRLYVQALRDQNIWQAGDLGDETFRKKLAILNGIDRYIETHHDPQEETVLRPHQISSMEKLRDFLESGGTHGWITLPTGFGKTVIFTEMVKALQVPCVIVVPTTELVEQTLKQINRFFPSSDVGRVDQLGKDFGKKIIVTTYASFVHQVRENNIRPNKVGVLILDEVHEALSDQRKAAIERFNQNVVLGFTATPDYSEKKGVSDLLEREVHSMSILDSVHMGALSGFFTLIAKTKVDLSAVQITSTGEYNADDLEKKVNVESRNMAAVQLCQQVFPGKTVFVNCSSIQHAKDVATCFEKSGIKSAAIFGENPNNTEIIAQAQAGDIQVLCGVRLLVRGIDIPRAEVCLNLHPTYSRVDVLQRGGRVLRLDPNNPDKHAYIVDFVDEEKRKTPLLFSVALGWVFGAQKQFSVEGQETGSRVGQQPRNWEDIEIEGLQVIVSIEEQEQFLQERAAATTSNIGQEGESMELLFTFSENGNIIFLTSEGKRAKISDLEGQLRLFGVPVPSRATLSRARQRGYFSPDYHKKEEGKIQRKSRHGHVKLTAEERDMTSAELVVLHGVTSGTAFLAQKRGWYEVSKDSKLTNLARSRVEGENEFLPEDLHVEAT